MRRSYVLAIVFLALAAASSKGWSSSDAQTHVYVAGQVGNSRTGIQLPVYWKDGQINYLPLDPTCKGGQADYVAVDGSGTVYIQGQQWGGKNGLLVGYWKGSSFNILSHGSYSVFWDEGIGVDSSGNVWVVAVAGRTSPPSVPVFWENSGAPKAISGASNIWTVATDKFGNAFFAGTAGGANSFVARQQSDSKWIPTVWKNGTMRMAVPMGGGTLGMLWGVTADASGTIYAFGQTWSGGGGVSCWKLANDAWGDPEILNLGSYSGNGSFMVDGMAIDGSGSLNFLGLTWSSGPPPVKNGFITPSALPIYWKGSSNAPAALPLSGYAYYALYYGCGAADGEGNCFFSGSLTQNPSPSRGPIMSVPVYWENGSDPTRLDLGTQNGTANDYGRACAAAAGP